MSIPNDYHVDIKQVRTHISEDEPGTKLLFVIQGELLVTVAKQTYQLAADDILIINRRTPYVMQSDGDNVVILLTISDSFFAYYDANYFHCTFECFSKELDHGREKMVTSLRRYLSEIVMIGMEKKAEHRLELESALLQILLLLTRFFKSELSLKEERKNMDSRISKIIQRLQEHYDEPITLNELASREYLSSTYLSRYFKKVTGYGFLQYLTEVRLKHALQDLLHSSCSITEIALKNGFTSQKHFSNIFKQRFGRTPTTYRVALANKQGIEKPFLPVKNQMQNLELTPSLLAQLVGYYRESKPEKEMDRALLEQKTITLHQKEKQELAHPIQILAIGELKEILKAIVREEITVAQEELGINYIGIRHLLRGKTFLPEVETDELIPTSYPYANADLALNFLKQKQLHLFIRIEYQDISADEAQAFEKLRQFLCHSIQVYGKKYISKWYMMFFEPANTLVDKQELKRVYLKLYACVKGILPMIQVGNFVPFSSSKNDVSGKHDWFLEAAEQIDFIAYNANQNEAVDFSESDVQAFIATQNYCLTKTKKLKQYLHKHKIAKPLMLINWNTLSGNTRRTNGLFFRGALILKNLLMLAPEVDGIGFWINTELHEESNSIRNISLDGLKLFHFFKGRRPAFYAVKFMNRLHGQVVAQGSYFIMTKKEESYQLVLMNCATINPHYSLEEKILKEERREFHLRILGMEEGEYQIRKWQFDRDNGALYSKYWKLNSKHGLDEEIMDYIVYASQPTLTVMDETISANWSFYTNLDMNAIHFYEFRRMIV